MALHISMALAIYIASQYLLYHVSIIQAGNLSVSFKLHDRNLVDLKGDAFFMDENVIQLTISSKGLPWGSAGRVVYQNPVSLWDASTQSFANFTTHFQFQINWTRDNEFRRTDIGGSGLAFFMASADSGTHLLYATDGAYLGLFNEQNNGNSSNQLVAVEFDTHRSFCDENDNHIGIDVNNITSEASVQLDQRLNNTKIWDARIDYRGKENMLSVSAGSEGKLAGQLSHNINLTKYLPEKIVVGFSAASNKSSEIHRLISWNFTTVISVSPEIQSSKSKRDVLWKAGILAGCGLVGVLIFVYSAIYKWQKGEKNGAMEEEQQRDVDMEMEISVMEHVPRKFTYEELNRSTCNFSQERKLGQGGFGDVYKGILLRSDEIVAVKRISAGSKQGKREYLAEISTINRLRHRNLVQLLGWCHEKAQLLLVYEYMPNGSLDSFLFGQRRGKLEWNRRYRIATDIANALLYLHELWDECVVHRDIKSSNVLLDAEINAKLGDFGLARLVKHDEWVQTTKVAGTLGYLAPECAVTGISSTESDVFSFGAVALEIACGRAVLDHSLQISQVRLVEWVWGLYGEKKLFDAADTNLNGVYDRAELKQLVVIGLWCSHPDPSSRPKIRQVLQLLNFEVPLPRLPRTLPKATYSPLPLEQDFFSQSSDFPVSADTTTTADTSMNSSIGMGVGR